MIYALDTNIISYLLSGDINVTNRWRQEKINGNKSVIPIMAYYEAKRGLIAANAKSKLKEFEDISAALGVDALSRADVDTASHIYAKRKKQGKTIEDADILIAAQAVARGYTLVTNNVKHFEGTDGLTIENWVCHLTKSQKPLV
jgi:predicted nucleic acid-binding protein